MPQVGCDIGVVRLDGRKPRQELILEQQIVVGQGQALALLVETLEPGLNGRVVGQRLDLEADVVVDAEAAAALAGIGHWWISRIWSGSSTRIGSLLPSRTMISTRRFWARCWGVSLGTLGRVSA